VAAVKQHRCTASTKRPPSHVIEQLRQGE